METASEQRRERIAVVGGSGLKASELVERAAELNSERMVLVGPDLVRGEGTLPGVFASAALAERLPAGQTRRSLSTARNSPGWRG